MKSTNMNIMSTAVTTMRLNMIHAVAMNTRSMSTIITNTAHAAAATTTNTVMNMSTIIMNMSTTMSMATKVAAAATRIAGAATKAAFLAVKRL